MLFGKGYLSPRTSFGLQTCGIPLERVLGLRLRPGQRGSGILQELAFDVQSNLDTMSFDVSNIL